MHTFFGLLLITLSFWPVTRDLSQQKKTPEPSTAPLLVRTTFKHEVRRFAYGGTVTLIGAPEGSVSIEGWSRNEVDIRAEIQLRANTEADLDLLARLNTVALDEDTNHIRIMTTGTHDKAFMRVAAKKFPKALLGLPWKIDYRIRVPVLTDMEVNAGRGTINLSGVEGNVRVSGTESDAKVQMSGGTFSAMIAVGRLDLTIPTRSWRGLGAEVRLAMGEVTVALPPGFSGDIDAEILRSGQINDLYGLEAREKPGLTAQKVKARAGAGGSSFRLTVGDGTISIKKIANSKQ